MQMKEKRNAKNARSKFCLSNDGNQLENEKVREAKNDTNDGKLKMNEEMMRKKNRRKIAKKKKEEI